MGHLFLRREALVMEENTPIMPPNYQSTVAESAVVLNGREQGDLIGEV